MPRYQAPIVCRCGRTTRDWTLVYGLKLCPECAYDETEVIRPLMPERVNAQDYLRPRFTIRRLSRGG